MIVTTTPTAWCPIAFTHGLPARLGIIAGVWHHGLAGWAESVARPILDRCPGVRRVILSHPEGLDPTTTTMTWGTHAAAYGARPHLHRDRDIEGCARTLADGGRREVWLYAGQYRLPPGPRAFWDAFGPWYEAGVRTVVIDGTGEIDTPDDPAITEWHRAARGYGLTLVAEGPPAPKSLAGRERWPGFATHRFAGWLDDRPALAGHREHFRELAKTGDAHMVTQGGGASWHPHLDHARFALDRGYVPAVPLFALEQVAHALAQPATPSSGADEHATIQGGN